LAQKDYEKAITELQQANLQDPRNLYRLGQANDGKGDHAKAQSSTAMRQNSIRFRH
jgi:hypothetical protein